MSEPAVICVYTGQTPDGAHCCARGSGVQLDGNSDSTQSGH